MMNLPELPALTEDTLLSVSIRGAAGENGEAGLFTTLTAQRSGEGENAAVVWRSGGSDVTDSATVQALLEDFASLSISKCIDYRPSDEAASICGFDSPSAQVSITYQANGMEQTLALTIGNSVTDGRYVRFDEDPTIYLLPTSLLDPLMRVSANGLGD
jgi:hypothetical protein